MTSANFFTVSGITFARRGSDSAGNEYRNYIRGRGVCGLVVVIGGEAEYTFKDGRVKRLKQGEIAVFSEKTAYVVTNPGSSAFSHYTVNFTLCEHHELPADEAYLKVQNITPVIEKCEVILDCLRKGHPALVLKAMSMLYSVLGDVYENRKVELSDRKDYINILPAISCIESEYSKNISIEQLSKLCMMSTTSFRRTFLSVCGTSPIEYLIRTRILRAKELLKHTSFTVSEIALSCGFKATEHFCRTFKSRTGMTAASYRNTLPGG